MQNSIHARGVGTSLAPVPWNLRTLSQSAFPVTSSRVSTSAHAFFSRTSSGSSSCSLPYGSQVWLQPCRLGSYLHRPWRTSRVACKASTAAPLSAETAVSVRQSYRFHSKAGAVVDVCVEPGQTKTLVDIRVSYENASWGTPEQLQLHWWVCHVRSLNRMIAMHHAWTMQFWKNVVCHIAAWPASLMR